MSYNIPEKGKGIEMDSTIQLCFYCCIVLSQPDRGKCYAIQNHCAGSGRNADKFRKGHYRKNKEASDGISEKRR